jgi:hypothetical protein
MTDPKYMRKGLTFAHHKCVEELGELLAALGKTGRWGWMSYNPELPEDQRELNIQWVMREMLDVNDAINNLLSELENAVDQGVLK